MVARKPLCLTACLIVVAASSSSAADVKSESEQLTILLRQLGDKRYAKREAASKALEAIGEPAWYPLRKLVRTTSDLEVRRRAARLVEVIGKQLFREVRRFGGAQAGYWVNRVAFTPDGRRAIATGGGVMLYDLESGKELARTLELQFARRGLAVSADGRHFLTGHQHDRVVRLGDVKTWSTIRNFEGHTAGVWCVALSADGARAASGGDDGTARIWDVRSGKELHTLRSAGKVRAVTFAPDGRHLLSGHYGPGSDHLIRLWDVDTGKEARRFPGHGKDVTAVAFLPDGRSFLSASMDGTLRLWDVQTGKELRRMAHGGGAFDAAVAPDGQRALSAGFGDRTVRLWDLTDGSEMHGFTGHAGGVLGVAFSADGRQALSSDSQYTIRLWRLPAPAAPSAAPRPQ
jgi:WD40 repeat protein